jgi:hypothetical protein
MSKKEQAVLATMGMYPGILLDKTRTPEYQLTKPKKPNPTTPAPQINPGATDSGPR